MTTKSLFNLTVQGYDPSPTPYDGGVSYSKVIRKTLENGNGAGQIQTVSAYDQVVAASGTVSLDLKTAVDAYGVALALDELALLYIENASDGNGGVLTVGPNASNGFTNLMGASSVLKLPKGAFMLVGLADFLQIDKYVVTGSNKVLDIIETGGANSAHLIMQIWGRK